ncbi:type IX secretion system membrane protein, PorP/SprF family [Chitinophaga sp. YR627]|uniref:PorP/SprF family type IX secretion system membrane protein n=1 Tax=Chitinophaga sp. YR627 TaxID=1881041 RepID=UPI0008F0C578|nr:type IX secretion system membrane protein PorP/SprF [Chitinophaga sp. YR627]SFN30846.1 type IX secretion system membrane protein, PorP/SprF family [Chitinophaga sp. YR627]
MYTTKKWFTVVLLLCLAAGSRAQQSVQFSQYIFNGLAINPAYAGYKDVLHLNASYRQQWTGFEGAPRTGSISLDGPLNRGNRDANVGLGIQAMMDNLGPQSAISLYASYAYRIRLDEEDTRRLCFGLGVGATQYGMNGKDLVYETNGDRIIPDGSAKATTPDARVGIYYYTPSVYIGVSVLDLLSKYTSSGYKWRGYTYESIRRKQHLYVTAGYMFNVNDDISLKPSVLFKSDFSGPAGLDATLMMHIDELLWVGGSYRTNLSVLNKKSVVNNTALDKANAVSGILEYYISPKYRIGYSYDYSMNKLAGIQTGSHELSIGILFNSKLFSTSNPRYF